MGVDWQVAYLLTTTLAVILLMGAAGYGWRFRGTGSGFWYAAFCGSAAAWAALVGLMALSPPEWAMRWLALKYLFIQLTPVALLMFTLEFTGVVMRRRRALLAALLVVPVFTQWMVWTNDQHHAMLRDVVFERSGIVTYIARIVFGPYYWVTVAQGYLLVLASLALVVLHGVRAGALQRRQTGAIALGILVPALANVLLITKAFPRVADPMPIGLVVSALLLWWAALAHRMLDLVPVARNAMVDATADGMLAFDAKGRVIDANAAMRQILGSPGEDPVGTPVSRLFAGAPALAGLLGGAGTEGDGRMPAGADQAQTLQIGEREFDVRLTPLSGRGASLLVLHDLTERRDLERQREAVIAELLAAVAKVRTLEGMLPMCASCKQVRTAADRWLPVDQYLREQAGAVVSHGICPDCSRRLYPGQYLDG